MSLAMEPVSKLPVENSLISSWEASRDFDQKRTFGNTFRRSSKREVAMPNSRKLKLSSRSFGLSEKTTPRKSWSMSYSVGSLSKDWSSRFLEEEAKKDEQE